MTESIKIKCPQCDRKLNLAAKYAGKKIKCPSCQAVLKVPDTNDGSEAKRKSRRTSSSRSLGDHNIQRSRRQREPLKSRQHESNDLDWEDDYSDEESWNDDPYAAPANEQSHFDNHLSARQSGPNGFALEGNQIRCKSGVHLPKVCVKTGETSQLVKKVQTVVYSPIWAFLLGGVILLALLQKKCEVTYWVSEQTQKRARKIALGATALVVLGVGLIMWDAIILKTQILMFLGVLMIIGGMCLLFIGRISLRAVRHKDGVFWLKGPKAVFFEVAQRRR